MEAACCEIGVEGGGGGKGEKERSRRGNGKRKGFLFSPWRGR